MLVPMEKLNLKCFFFIQKFKLCKLSVLDDNLKQCFKMHHKIPPLSCQPDTILQIERYRSHYNQSHYIIMG